MTTCVVCCNHEAGELRRVFFGRQTGLLGTPTRFADKLPRQRGDEIDDTAVVIGILLCLVDCRGIQAAPRLERPLFCLQARQAEGRVELPRGLLIGRLKGVWVAPLNTSSRFSHKGFDDLR